MIDAIMRSPMWKNTALFVTWDDYGGTTITSPRHRWMASGSGSVPLLVISP